MESSESGEGGISQLQENDMTGWWEPRVKVNLADQLPGNSDNIAGTKHQRLYFLMSIKYLDNTYLAIQSGRYLFPGAELFYDPDEEVESDSDSSDASDSSGIIDGSESSVPFPEHGIKRKAMD